MDTSDNRLEDGGVCLLSLDGSKIGTTELSLLLLLRELMQRIEDELGLDETPRPHEYFDLIGGTGVGGIFALFFAFWRLSVDEAIEAYQILYTKVFTSEAWSNEDTDVAGQILDSVIDEIATGLGKDSTAILGTAKKSSTDCKAFTCTLNPDNVSNPRLFCTYRARANRSPKCTIAQVLRASIAGSPYLDPILLGLPAEKFISANHRVSNPTSQVLNEAQAIFGTEKLVACIVSLGTGQREPLSVPSNAPADNISLSKLVQDTEQSEQEIERRCGSERDFFFRLSVVHGLEETAIASDALSKIATDSHQYLQLAAISGKVDRLVKVLCERQGRVTTRRLNSIFGPEAQDKTLELVKDIHHEIKRKSIIDQAGGGKTFLASIVYDHLCKIYSHNKDTQVVGAFITYGVTMSIDQILSCLLCQLAEADTVQWGPEIEDLYRKRNHGRPSSDKLVEALESRLSRYASVMIILDALDEFPSSDRQRLLDVLLGLSPVVYLFVTTRPTPLTTARKVTHKCLQMDTSKRSDLESFVRNKMHNKGRLRELLADRKELSEKVLKSVLQRCNGMFLLARFHMDKLAEYRTPKALEIGLSSLPTTASKQYDITLERIRKQPGRDGIYALHALRWMTLGRQHSWTIAQIALAVASSTDELEENAGTALSEQFIVDVCSGLIKVEENDKDEWSWLHYRSKSVSFVHLTAQEHFRDYFDRAHEDRFHDAHYTLAIGCLRYICAPYSPETASKWDKHFLKFKNFLLEEAEFFRYCAMHWGNHARHLRGDDNGKFVVHMFSRCLQLDVPRSKQGETKFVDCNICDEDLQLITELRRTSLLSACSCLNLAIVMKGRDPELSRTALSYAAGKGLYDLVELLLCCPYSEKMANSKDEKGRSALVYASEFGHQDIVELILSKPGIEVDSQDLDGRSPLSHAAANGHRDVVELFLCRSAIDADSRDCDGRSPLGYAAANGHRDVVELFLSRSDIDADFRDSRERSPLSYASANGHRDVAKLFLCRSDVEADSRDWDGQSPLSYAAVNGHWDVVKLFPNRSYLDADHQDSFGESLLSHAAENGYGDVFELLLNRSDVEADSRDRNRQSPLSFAARYRHLNVVELFLGRSDVEADSRDWNRRSPLSHAAENGHQDIVGLLLGRSDVETDSRDRNGRSPLSHAAEKGNRDVVELLLGRSDVDADSRDIYGRSPLSHAARNGHLNVVERLLRESSIDPDSKDVNGKSALDYAEGNGHRAVVELIRGRRHNQE